MAQTLVQFETPVARTDGALYQARACGHERADGLWEGWIEFTSAATGEVVPTVRETTQPNLTDLTYWATGLSTVYLEGALARIFAVRRPVETVPVSPPRYARPAEPRERPPVRHEAVLNPFSVYEKNPDVLAQELTALRAWHLRQIIRDYSLVDESDVRIESMSEPELGSLIMQRVRALHP
jgi:hypothetical protein